MTVKREKGMHDEARHVEQAIENVKRESFDDDGKHGFFSIGIVTYVYIIRIFFCFRPRNRRCFCSTAN